MKVSGFTFIKNAVKYDYPFVESVKSVLPLCDEFIIVHGNSEDSTNELIRSIDSSKIKIINTVWDANLKKGGLILSQQTNIALDHASGDWCFYIQADEVVHEKYHSEIREKMRQYLEDKRVEGLLFKYLHFYGNYNYVASSRQWYRNEIRIIRNNIGVRSFKDAQGFIVNDRKLNVKPVDAYIYHYGWARLPEKMQKKVKYFHSLWHDENWIEKNVPDNKEYDFSRMDSLNPFKDTHPAVMKNRIEKADLHFSPDISTIKKSFTHILLDFIEQLTGYRIGEYKNYKIIK